MLEVILIAALVVGAVAIAGVLLRRGAVVDSPGPRAWRDGAAKVCAAGREVVDLSVADPPGDHGSGLTVQELSVIEAKLDLLVAQIHDLTPSAPTPAAAHQMSLAAEHATALHDVLSTERRVLLSSMPSTFQRLDTITFQVVAERSALDNVLRDISEGVGGAP